ncbi:MAG: MBL fold metallo-hydrolase [Eubacteriaceae bacterium]|nr:MBL fold metallo-hydrolase [Eubacteriaceae bacterium]
MITKINSEPEIYQFHIPLPNNPLKNLNCYVVKTENGNLLVDTGFNQTECFAALTMSLRELNIDMNETTLFLTHLHLDHIGLVDKIRSEKTRVLMGAEDYDYFGQMLTGNIWDEFGKRFFEEGFPLKSVHDQEEIKQAIAHTPQKLFDITPIRDGESFFIGNYEFECVLTPGHTPGNTCLYLKNEKIMFSGDHILFDITPSIIFWPNVRNSLKDYLTSLEKLKTYDICLALPGHRSNKIDVYERIEQLKKHHLKRVETIYNIVKMKKNQNAYQIASQLEWFMRGKSWSQFPNQQKVFAVGETISHLDYLFECNRINKFIMDGVFVYHA